ncbi:amino acid--tRNA ligase-related protein, partial [Rhodococcus sp. LB1]|uniref:amino acid--tRNA ligase-related protein n=1 Tax=Rhodococcus sp. LB1 TaxID=1807499 RepID=UPI002F917B88
MGEVAVRLGLSRRREIPGGQRLHNHADYIAALASRSEDPADYAPYLEAMGRGMPPHGGFAIGLGHVSQ